MTQDSKHKPYILEMLSWSLPEYVDTYGDAEPGIGSREFTFPYAQDY